MCPAIIIILKTLPLNISELTGKYGVECTELFFFDSPLMILVSTVFLFTLLYFLERVYLWNLLCLHGPARCCRIWKPTCRGFTCAQTMRNILGFARPLQVNVSNVQYNSILRTPKALRWTFRTLPKPSSEPLKLYGERSERFLNLLRNP